MKFVFRATNNTEWSITAFDNGIRVYSTDGATWEPVTADTCNLGWESMFNSVHTCYNSADGEGADTVGFFGANALGTGFPSTFNDTVWYIETRVGPEHIGKHLCLDSSYSRSCGPWYWEYYDGGFHEIAPAWDGPYCFEIVAPEPEPAEITLDTVIGLAAQGQVTADTDLKFVFRATNNVEEYSCHGFTTGFRVYSPDGATWDPLTTDTCNLDWSSMFDLHTETPVFSNGEVADTVGFGASVMIQQGFPPLFSDTVWFVETSISSEHIGKHICIDSSYYPPSGMWAWYIPEVGVFEPAWDGPHCFEIVAATCCVAPSVGDIDQSGQTLPFNVDGIDLSIMLDGLFISLNWSGYCLDEGDVDFSCGRPCTDDTKIDGIDLSYMLDALFISLDPLPQCDGTPNP